MKLVAKRTQSAEADLRSIAYQIALKDGRIETAERVIDAIIAVCETLAHHSQASQIGTLCPELGNQIRLFSHSRWVIIFRYRSYGIDVLRIADSSQDYWSWTL